MFAWIVITGEREMKPSEQAEMQSETSYLLWTPVES